MSTTDWTVNQLGDEWNVVEWNDHFDPEVRPKFSSSANGQARACPEAAAVGGLDLQLVYYRGLAECRASGWIAEPKRFGELMSRIDCRGGQTQIAKILAHARRENDRQKVAALVFVAESMEETLDNSVRTPASSRCAVFPLLCSRSYDPACEQAFREIARLTRGAYCCLEPGAAHELGELLRAVAAYAAGGMKALAALQARSPGANELIEQMK